MSHHCRGMVKSGSSVAWQKYLFPSPACKSWVHVDFRTISSVQLVSSISLFITSVTGLSQASFHNIRHAVSHPPSAFPSQRGSRCSGLGSRRAAGLGLTLSEVLCARL